ncbi:N-formylglutamate amidohydrolase [Thiohalobacter sp. IOR34]|uniref:N-formylglutamate amidohydrolase n=1 Tax=Thiohalobacter sp. IOR34 TaxID=3057176 RepID=UPI0025B031E1|nr:N-formylglutamate amidohydrolase [Thiohalobacter sp. IOR34]WJW76400.1 N-formylglutamate amidohydrolase [Thiohalobacter sp. IOR34]
MRANATRLPLLLSVPHAGLRVPPEVSDRCLLSERDIVEDGDEGAAEIYRPLAAEVEVLQTTDIARAIVDLNRAEDDFSPDGVIKTHTCWGVPVYREFPPPALVERLLERYYRPYHARLGELATAGLRLAVDCHTMAAIAPPVAPDAGQERPAVCLGDGGGRLPAGWVEALLECFAEAFAPHRVTLNQPFSGGYITRSHGREMPWIQLELSRAPFLGPAGKRQRVLQALRAWCARHD